MEHNNCKKCRGNNILFLAVISYSYFLANDLYNRCAELGGKVNAISYTLMLNDPYFILLLSLSLTTFFADATYNKIKMMLSIKYAVRFSIGVGLKLSLWLCFVSIIRFLPNISFSNTWDDSIKALSTYAKGNMHFWYINNNIIESMSPVQSLIEAVIVIVMYSVFTAFIICACRKIKPMLAIVAITCFSDFQVINDLPSIFTYISPQSIMRISLTSSLNFVYLIGYYLTLITLIIGYLLSSKGGMQK